MIITKKSRLSLILVSFLFAIGVIMVAGEAFADWYDSDWNYRKPITVQAGQVSSGPHLNFPVLISISSDADLAAKAQADGGDIIFTNQAGTIKFAHETTGYSSGTLLAWVNVNSINNGTIIYMYYGHVTPGQTFGITEAEADAVWTNNYIIVHHLDETSDQHIDSTSNDYNSTSVVVASQGQTATAKIGGADEFSATDGQAVSIPDPGASSALDLAGNGNVTYSVWIYPRTEGQCNQGGIFSKGSAGFSIGYRFGLDRINCGGVSHTLVPTRAGNWSGICNPTPQATPNAWNYVVYTFDNSTSPDSHYLYKNGPQITTASGDSSASDTLLPLNIGVWQNCEFDGFIDEVRISNTNRSAGWIQTEYNNQFNPGIFHGAPGSEENTFTWDGSASSDWGNPANWDMNAVPGAGHTVIIPDVANAPVLDTARTAAVLTINGESVDLNGNSLTISGDLTMSSSGILDASTGTPIVTVGGSWDFSGGTFMPGGGTVRFNGTGAHSITSGSSSFYNLVFDNVGGTWTLQDALDVDNDLTITSGTLVANGNNINVGGNWTNNGTFIAGTGAVTLDGTGTQAVWSGGSLFNTLEVTNSTSDVTFLDGFTAVNFTSNTPSAAMRFNAGSTYTVTNLTLNGAEGSRITLRSTSPGTWWFLNVSGTQSLSYVDVSDSDASGGNPIICTTGCIGLNENNDNWVGLLVAIPTMTQWGMILFMVLAGLGAVYYLRRRRVL